MRKFGAVVLVSLLLAAPSTAQVLQAPTDDSVTVRPVARKDPGAAFLISFASGFALLPGLGSFYAGNSRHGARHLIIGFAATGAFLASLKGIYGCAYFNEWCIDPQGAWLVLTVAALFTYAGNYVWSLGTAVEDANAFNRRRRAARTLGFRPSIIDLSSRPPATSSPSLPRWRIGLGLTANF